MLEGENGDKVDIYFLFWMIEKISCVIYWYRNYRRKGRFGKKDEFEIFVKYLYGKTGLVLRR